MIGTRHKVLPMFLLTSLLALLLGACTGASDNPARTLTIVSGSENRTLEPIIQTWADQNNYNIEITYLGSLDISRQLRTGNIAFDAVWPANRLWLDYGDISNITRHSESIIRSPVVFGLKRSVAERLGWTDGRDIFMRDILDATESGEVRFMMTSATQSNSGASFYFAALSAFAGSPEVISSDNLNDPTVQEEISRILGTVDRSSGSSGWLADLFINEYDRFDAMVNYEAVLIETNQELASQGRDPLYAIYPVDGLAIADSPLAYVERGLEDKEDIFLELQAFLLEENTQRQLLGEGRRTSTLGIQLSDADRDVFRPEWGIDVDRVIQPIRFPNAEVIQEALTLYQTTFRRPSCTAYVLDFSGSMVDNGEDELKAAMRTLLDQNIAQDYLLQGHPEDVSLVVLFETTILNRDFDDWIVEGNDPAELRDLYLQIEDESAGGGTNIFGAALEAYQELEDIREDRDCLPSVIVMTDGADREGLYGDFERYISRTENDIPVFAITFGNADEEELIPMTDLTFGRLFDGTEDLIEAFRSAKGYN
ncbi:MAG: substrate-binding domain-containing protein [Chloroflexota bacterium]